VWTRFERALLPLDSVGKLGVIVFQLPPWFVPKPGATDYLVEVRERLAQYRVAVEFRHGLWLTERHAERTLRVLTEHRLAFVCVDEPQGFPNSVPPVAATTSDVALVRFHGRNRETWAKPGISVAERFDYLYREEELREWLPRIERLAEQAQEVHLLMNNCREDKAVRGARQLQMLLHLPARAAD
jgi:uncharacterized protein YecE (DUF72 family)